MGDRLLAGQRGRVGARAQRRNQGHLTAERHAQVGAGRHDLGFRGVAPLARVDSEVHPLEAMFGVHDVGIGVQLALADRQTHRSVQLVALQLGTLAGADLAADSVTQAVLERQREVAARAGADQ